MTGITDAKGNKFTYEYDGKHNVTKGTSAQGVVYKLSYDSAGNVIKSSSVEVSHQTKGTWMERTMTASKNFAASVTDTYTYTKDRLTAISHNGFNYGFAYDAFGNILNASVAGSRVVSYEYEANNGNLKKVTYANGAYIRYSYDEQDRMLLSYYKDPSCAEQKLNGYVYDRQGNLAQVTNYPSGKTYDLDYDFLGRLMRARDNEKNYYEYTYDANNQMTRMYHGTGTSGIATTYTYDKDGREVTAKASGNYYLTTDYDSLGRVVSQMWTNPTKPSGVIFQYSDTDSTKRSGLPDAVVSGSRNIGYTYDGNGNITKIQDSDTNAIGGTTKAIVYQYDELNRLIRENNQILNKTVVYSYDVGGNLVSEKEYAYTTGTLPSAAVSAKTGTFDGTWKDKLMKWGSTAMTYDAVGNMLTKGSVRYTWTQGRKLSGVENGRSIRYYYDHTGNRTKKVVDGAATQFCYAGDLLVSERTGSEKNLWYRYDSAGNVISVTYDSNIYMYIRNVQNDVIAMLDRFGETVVKYTYDSWGKVEKIEGTMAKTLGERNPFRYRGYYYDTETGLYYISSRYYDPELRRFISADDMDVLSTEQGNINQYNLYAYCLNNPVNRVDVEGYFSIPNIAKVAIGGTVIAGLAVASIATGGTVAVICGAALSGAIGGSISGVVLGGIGGGLSGDLQGVIDGACSGFMDGAIVGGITGSIAAGVNIGIGGTTIINKAHGSKLHKLASNMEAGKMAASGRYSKIGLNTSMKRMGLNGGLKRPDVTGIGKKGVNKVVEVVSPKQSISCVRKKVSWLQGSNSGLIGKVVTWVRRLFR